MTWVTSILYILVTIQVFTVIITKYLLQINKNICSNYSGVHVFLITEQKMRRAFISPSFFINRCLYHFWYMLKNDLLQCKCICFFSAMLLTDKPTAAGINKATNAQTSWRRHQMEAFSALLGICAGNSPVTGEFPAQRPATRSFDVFLDLHLNERLSKQSWGWWFATPLRPCAHDVRVM